LGIKAKIKNKDILVGNERLLKQFGVEVKKEIKEELNIVYIAIDSKFEGFIVVSDIIKNEAKDFINELKKLNISKTYMLTGDKKEVALKVHFYLN
jgi:Cd2+/Zn2+-exporting ATPase